MSNSVVKKAVFPVAGLGTRILPATKSIPKELLPVVDKPILQYVVDEAVDAGINELIFVVSRTKNSIQDYFDKAYELETELEKKNKVRELELIRSLLPDDVHCAYVRQPEALGLGHAVLCASKVIGDEPFAVILPDDLMDDGGTMSKMVDMYGTTGSSIIAVERIDKSMTDKYGVIATEDDGSSLPRITGIVEKPSPEKAPSNLAVVGRYVFSPACFPHLEQTKPGVGGEIQLTDAVAALLRDEAVHAYELEGRRFDCGTKLGYLEANVHFALNNNEVAAGFRDYLRKLELE